MWESECEWVSACVHVCLCVQDRLFAYVLLYRMWGNASASPVSECVSRLVRE